MPIFLAIFAAGAFSGLWVRSELDSDSPIGLGTLVVGTMLVGGSYIAYRRFTK